MGVPSGLQLARAVHIDGRRPPRSRQAGLAERVHKGAVRSQPHLVAFIDGMHLGHRHGRSTAGDAGRRPLDTANRLKRAKLVFDRRNVVHRDICSPMRRTPGSGRGIANPIQQRCCSLDTGPVLGREALKLAMLQLAFSNSWRWIGNDQCSQLVRWRSFSQHSSAWDDWSSPDRLIHLGDSPVWEASGAAQQNFGSGG